MVRKPDADDARERKQNQEWIWRKHCQRVRPRRWPPRTTTRGNAACRQPHHQPVYVDPHGEGRKLLRSSETCLGDRASNPEEQKHRKGPKVKIRKDDCPAHEERHKDAYAVQK